MTNPNWKRIEEYFHLALEQPVGERIDYLRKMCGDDFDLFQKVQDLLESDVDDSFIEPPSGDAIAAQRESSDRPERVGPYEILSLLGQGGMGDVYLAKRQVEDFDQIVAIKLIRGTHVGSTVRERFLLERQTLARLDHPNIARLLDGGTTEKGDPYLVMEYVDGILIDVYCDSKSLTVDDRVRLLLPLCEAISYAHRQLVVHRDLKPTNILVTEDGIPKLVDFGIAKLLDDDERLTLTQAGGGPMTPGYASPEQMRGESIGTASDIYSLGVVLFELITGARPKDFKPVSPTSELHHTITKPSVAFRKALERDRDCGVRIAVARKETTTRLLRKLRGDLDNILAHALHPDPARRYGSVAELSTDLEHCISGRPVTARPDGFAYRARLFIRRNKVASLLAASLFTALTGFIFATLDSANRDRQRLERIMQLSDMNRLSDLRAKMLDLWPIHPKSQDKLNAWLSDANKLVSRIPTHQQSLNDLMISSGREGSETLFPDSETQWYFELLSALVRDLVAFRDGSVYEESMSNVRAREKAAETLLETTIQSERDAWGDVVEAVADMSMYPQYNGLVIEPQLGLVPIGQDPDTELFEFWHVMSGECPERDEEDRLVITDSTGIVFVLLPGGPFHMGSQLADKMDHNYDPGARPAESPVRVIELDPFMLSKYEVTQSQWVHVVGYNPSNDEIGDEDYGQVVTPRHPVESVGWNDVSGFCRRFDFVLPSEAQWEYAGRGGTSLPWIHGDSYLGLDKIGNLADNTCYSNGCLPEYLCALDLDDGYSLHCPVGIFEPNGFGLHDMMGNVSEWCLDVRWTYDHAVLPGTGARLDKPSESFFRCLRGSAFNGNPNIARVATRLAVMEDYRSNDVGFRPVRELKVGDL